MFQLPGVHLTEALPEINRRVEPCEASESVLSAVADKEMWPTFSEVQGSFNHVALETLKISLMVPIEVLSHRNTFLRARKLQASLNFVIWGQGVASQPRADGGPFNFDPALRRFRNVST